MCDLADTPPKTGAALLADSFSPAVFAFTLVTERIWVFPFKVLIVSRLALWSREARERVPMFADWSQRRRWLRSAILVLSAPWAGTSVTLADGFGTSVGPTVERLPPVAVAAPVTLPQQPTELSAPGLGTRRDANSLFLGDSFGKKMDEIADEAPLSGTQSVAYSAIEAAQTTLPQCYYAGADYLLIRPQMSEPAAFLFGHGDNNGNVNAALNTFDFNYQSSPRVFLGYRSPTSGSGIQFTYWHFQENASSNFNATTQNSGFIPDVNFIWFLIGQGNNNNNNGPDFGNQVNAQMHLRFNTFDIDLYKPVALGNGRWLLTGSVGADHGLQPVDHHVVLQQWHAVVQSIPSEFVHRRRSSTSGRSAVESGNAHLALRARRIRDPARWALGRVSGHRLREWRFGGDQRESRPHGDRLGHRVRRLLACKRALVAVGRLHVPGMDQPGEHRWTGSFERHVEHPVVRRTRGAGCVTVLIRPSATLVRRPKLCAYALFER